MCIRAVEYKGKESHYLEVEHLFLDGNRCFKNRVIKYLDLNYSMLLAFIRRLNLTKLD
jgi:hypothetical protein